MRGSALLGFVALMHIHAGAQHFSLLVGPTYGFGAGTIMPKAGAKSTNGASGPGWQLGGAYDGLPDSVAHCRVRLAWQRNYWSENYTGTARSDDYYWLDEPIKNVGLIESRIDMLTITPLWVIPLGTRFRALFGADLSLMLNSRVHNSSVSTFYIPSRPDAPGGGMEELVTDSIGSGIDYMNQYHLAIPVGLEVDLLHHWSISAEFSVGVSKFTNGSPARYGRLVLCRKLYD